MTRVDASLVPRSFRSGACSLGALALLGCAPSTSDVLAAFVQAAEKADATLSAVQLAATGQTTGQATLLCDGPVDGGNRENITGVVVEFSTVDVGGFPLPDPAQQRWGYLQWECFTDGVRTDGTVVIDITRADDGTWALAWSGNLWVSDSETCTLTATATADATGALTGPIQGTFCDQPLENFGVQLMVPDFAY